MAGALKHLGGEVGYRAAKALRRDVIQDSFFRKSEICEQSVAFRIYYYIVWL